MRARARRSAATLAAIGVLVAPLASLAQTAAVVRVGSKSFTESYVLGEIVAQVAEQAGHARVERKLGLGGTGIVYHALVSGEIDVYPEYTGTIARAILKDPSVTTIAAMREHLNRLGLAVSDPLGFDNTYALAVRRDAAARLRIATIGDLARHPEFTAAFDPGFLDRDDGWAGLRLRYGLRFSRVRTMDHSLTYRALMTGSADVIDVFSTDGQLAREAVTLLADDRRFFPAYAAVLLARRSFVDRLPRTWMAIERHTVGWIDNATMARLNAAADLDGQSFSEVAARFLGRDAGSAGADGHGADLGRVTLEHLVLVGVSVLVAIAVGVPLGIVAARRRLLGQLELASVGVLQTIPALALLTFMIPMFGIGRLPALIALCLYALLPIVRNTYAGLVSLDPALADMAAVIGLRTWQRLAWIELPMASVTILAGIKTSAVLTVGTATLAAFIGGGGYGTLIVTGLALNDVRTILAGAIPAALMALAIHALFEVLDRVLVPRGLRLAASARG